MKKFFTFTAALLFFFSLCAQTPAQKMDALLQAYADQYKFYGTALIAKGDETLLNKGYGYSDVADKKKNTEASFFQIGSITKQFTAALILMLEEKGKLSVQDKVNKFFPQFPSGDKITIHHLLSHTSGIYNYTNNVPFLTSTGSKAVDQKTLLSLFQDKPLDFEPGTKYSYSNSGYILLGHIIEQVTGKKWEQAVRENIFKPLGMNNTGFDFAGLKNGAKTTGYFSVSEVGAVPSPIIDSTFSYAAGSIYSTTADLLKWERALAKGRLLKKESWQKAMTPVKNNYGYGLIIDSLYGQKRVHHGGNILGYNSNAMWFPAQDYTIILFSNASSSLEKLSNDLAAVLYNKPYTIPEANKEVKVENAVLAQYPGEYELAPTFSITITLKDNYLYGQANRPAGFSNVCQKRKTFLSQSCSGRSRIYQRR